MTGRILDHVPIAVPNRATRGREYSHPRTTWFFMRRPWDDTAELGMALRRPFFTGKIASRPAPAGTRPDDRPILIGLGA
jgi:hypothetical protein